MVDNLPVTLFKTSFGPFVALLDEHNIPYKVRNPPAGAPIAGGMMLEIVQAVGDASFWASLAVVVVAFINRRRGRKIIVTTKANTFVHIEGIPPKEVEQLLQQAWNLAVVDPNKTNEEGKPD